MLAIKSWQHTTHLDFQGAFTSFKGLGGNYLIYTLYIYIFYILETFEHKISHYFYHSCTPRELTGAMKAKMS